VLIVLSLWASLWLMAASGSTALWAALPLCVIAVGLKVEADCDPYEFWQISSVLSLLCAFGFGLHNLLIEESTNISMVTAIAFGLTTVVCFVQANRLSRIEEILPNVLIERFSQSELRELEGVQFAVTQSETTVLAGEELIVTASAQNGFSSERVLRVELEPRAVGKSGQTFFDKNARLELPGGAAGELRIPVVVHPRAGGRQVLQLGVTVEAPDGMGERLRVMRVKRSQTSLTLIERAGLLLLGQLAWLGGCFISFGVRKNKQWRDLPVEEPAPSSSELTYEPDLLQLFGIANPGQGGPILPR
jgi:hypothetical protein